MSRPRLIVLGAGPAGLGAAYYAARTGHTDVSVVERGAGVGGNAGSFTIDGLHVDYGSHRLHPACDPSILRDIRERLGDDLLDRPRHGRIRLLGRWIHFPLKPLDLALRLPPTFGLAVARDSLLRLLGGGKGTAGRESFSTVLEAKLGRTIARDFYLPYARKIWGLGPEELSPIQARRRVSADSPMKLIRKVLAAVPGFKPPGAGRFYYPRRGYGQISEAYRAAAEEAGARIELESTVERIELRSGQPHRVVCSGERGPTVHDADRIWSTIPLSVLARSMHPGPPPEVLRATGEIAYRSMLLIYLLLDQSRFSEYDAHYFPGAEIPVTRISEPKNYGLSEKPVGRTVLCAELPCSTRDEVWSMSDAELGRVVADSLARVGLPVTAPVLEVLSRRLPQAYPIYRQGYEEPFQRLDRWIGDLPHLLTFGRQGLFAHDNTHHALYMARCAAECLDGRGGFDDEKWAGFRKVFETHVVED